MPTANTIRTVDSGASKLRRVTVAYFWSILIWLGFAPLLAFQDRVILLHNGHYANFWGILEAYGSWCFTDALLTPPIFYIVRRYPMTKRGVTRVAGYALGFVPHLVASATIRWMLLPPWDDLTQNFTPRSTHALIMYLQLFGSHTWDYVITLAAAHAYEYINRAEAQERERAELQQALAASELQSLRSQLHPHFLFNTLQGISTLITNDPRRANAMVLKLSGLLRTVLEHDNFDLISLSDELKFIESYIELQRIRLEERLSVLWDIQPETQQMLLPQLILQPLVENAIVHGIASCRYGGWLEISSMRRGTRLELSIRNSIGGSSASGVRLGLRSTEARMKYLYADEGRFSFEIDHDDVAVATLAFPSFAAHQVEPSDDQKRRRA